MVAYIERAARKTFNLVVVEAPCNGEAYTKAPRLAFSNKAEALAFCRANKIRPWNF